jgi:hypothetical protein
MISVSILLAVTRSWTWLACSAAEPAVLTVTFSPGYCFSSSPLVRLAQYTTPPAQPCVAAGMATPMLGLFCAKPGVVTAADASAKAANASLRFMDFTVISLL